MIMEVRLIGRYGPRLDGAGSLPRICAVDKLRGELLLLFIHTVFTLT